MSPLLQVRELAVSHPGGVEALRGASFDLDRGETLAVIGESGAGKSTLGLALAGLLEPGRARGSVLFDGRELIGAPEEDWRRLRWEHIALSLQGAAFNPVLTLGDQVAEPLRERRGMKAREALIRADELAVAMELDPAALRRYPHEVSGGERRRAAVAMALALDPELLVLDEPTSGLDPATAAGVTRRVRELAAEREIGLVVITHELVDAARLADRVAILYAGQVLETGPLGPTLAEPAHPYTWALVGAYPVMSSTKDLRPIRGTAPDPAAVPPGCPFHPRCPQAEQVCGTEPVALQPSRGRWVACHFGGLRDLLDVRGVGKTYGRRNAARRVLHDVSLTVREGESVGVIGPSGSGKSTLARVLTGHLDPDSGEVAFRGTPLPRGRSREERLRRARVQLVMQDPWDALSPRLPVAELVSEPLTLLDRDGDPSDHVRTALEAVGLPTTGRFLGARTHELSGGQLQRIALARALVAEPRLLVADEPTSLLDASEQARLMVTLRERQTELGLGLLIVSHDIALLRKVTDRLIVIDGGRVVETGRTATVCAAPRSETTQRLLAAAPTLDPLDGVHRPPPVTEGAR